VVAADCASLGPTAASGSVPGPLSPSLILSEPSLPLLPHARAYAAPGASERTRMAKRKRDEEGKCPHGSARDGADASAGGGTSRRRCAWACIESEARRMSPA
jgi:hypothetical protein